MCDIKVQREQLEGIFEMFVLMSNVVFYVKAVLSVAVVKAKVYFTLYAYTRDSVQCAGCEIRHQNSTRRIVFAHVH